MGMVKASSNSEPFTLNDNPVCDSLLTPNNKEKEHPYLSIIGGNGTCDDAMKQIDTSCYKPDSAFWMNMRISHGGCSSGAPLEGFQIAEKCSKDKGLEIYIVQDDNADKKNIDFHDKVCSGKVETAPALTSSDWIEPEEGRRFMCKDFTHSTSGDQNFILYTSLGKDFCPVVKEENDDVDNSSALGKDNLMMIAFVSILIHLTNVVVGTIL